jgi:starch synthase
MPAPPVAEAAHPASAASAAPFRAAAIAFTAADYDISGGVAGRRSASAGFLAAYLRHADPRPLTCLLHEPEDAPALHDFITRSEGGARPVACVALGQLPQLARAGALYTPGPELARYAWLRRGIGQRAFSLVGVTHTLSERHAMAAIGGLITAPLQPWDALVCTTGTAKRAVERVLEEYDAYFATLGGSRLGSRVRLPVIPLGVACEAFVAGEGERANFRARHGIPPEAPVLLCMGRLDHAEKANPVPLYMAAQHVAERLAQPLYLLEVGWFRSDFFVDAFAQAAQVLAPSVKRILLDSRQAENRRAWFAADIFVSLADSVQETFGLTPIEAMAAGLPAIVSDWDGYRETVRDGVDGFRVPTLAPPAGSGEAIAFDYAAGLANHSMFSAAASQSSAVEVEACAAAIARLVAEPELRRRMGAAARQRAREVFDWRVVISAYQDLWQELAEHRGAAAEAAPPAPGRPTRPLEMDPFDLFCDWPSARLAPETVVSLPAGVNAELAAGMRGLAAAAPMPAMLLAPSETGAIIAALERGPTAAGELVALLPAEQRDAGWRTLGWLAKTGLVAWR